MDFCLCVFQQYSVIPMVYSFCNACNCLLFAIFQTLFKYGFIPLYAKKKSFYTYKNV